MQGCQPGGLYGQMVRRGAAGLRRLTPGIAFNQCTRIPNTQCPTVAASSRLPVCACRLKTAISQPDLL